MLSTGLGVLLKTVQFRVLFPRESLAQSGYRSRPWPRILPALGYRSPCPHGLRSWHHSNTSLLASLTSFLSFRLNCLSNEARSACLPITILWDPWHFLYSKHALSCYMQVFVDFLSPLLVGRV